MTFTYCKHFSVQYLSLQKFEWGRDRRNRSKTKPSFWSLLDIQCSQGVQSEIFWRSSRQNLVEEQDTFFSVNGQLAFKWGRSQQTFSLWWALTFNQRRVWRRRRRRLESGSFQVRVSKRRLFPLDHVLFCTISMGVVEMKWNEMSSQASLNLWYFQSRKNRICGGNIFSKGKSN